MSSYPPNYVQPMPPPPAYGQPGVVYTQPTQTVVISTAGPMMMRMGPYPTGAICPNCKAQITTMVHYQSGCFTYLICALVFLVGCWLGCCLIPFCVNACKDAIHTCPNCRTLLGRSSRM